MKGRSKDKLITRLKGAQANILVQELWNQGAFLCKTLHKSFASVLLCGL